MRCIIGVLFFLASWYSFGEEESPIVYTNRVAPDPHFNVWSHGDITQITYTNGDITQPEIIILVCNNKTRRMDVQYYIVNGNQVTDAEFLTIQRYPHGWMKMGNPYYPPSVVIYNSAMETEKNRFSDALNSLYTQENWGIVFTFESITRSYSALTKAWSQVIPSKVLRRDLEGHDLTKCSDTETRILFPLFGVNNEAH